MADIAYWLAEYTKEVDQYAGLLKALQSLIDTNSTNNRKIIQTISQCDSKATKIKDVKKSYGLEMRLIKDRQEKYDYNVKMAAIDERLMLMNKDLKLIKIKQNKQELFEESNGKNQYSTEGKNNDELLDGANRIQDLTFDSLGRTRGMIEASKEVGAATIEELRRQKDQIKDIEAEVDNIDSTLKRAEKLLINFTRRMATDKLIQSFAAVNIVVMLGLTLYIAISGKSLSGSSSTRYVGPTVNSFPSSRPSFQPTTIYAPTILPSKLPTVKPSFRPTNIPSVSPTQRPTFIPSFFPSFSPSFPPSFEPSHFPTFIPTLSPTSLSPSFAPSQSPSLTPTHTPTANLT